MWSVALIWSHSIAQGHCAADLPPHFAADMVRARLLVVVDLQVLVALRTRRRRCRFHESDGPSPASAMPRAIKWPFRQCRRRFHLPWFVIKCGTTPTLTFIKLRYRKASIRPVLCYNSSVASRRSGRRSATESHFGTTPHRSRLLKQASATLRG